MKRGIALLEENTISSLKQAIGCFDKAIELRSGLPLDANNRFRYGLAAGWMNRGDALTRLASSEHFTEAVRSYDEALKYLCFLPLDEDVLFRKRLAIAWINRGTTLLAQGRNLNEARRSFDEGIALLGHEQTAALPERNQLLGCAWMNRGNTLLRLAKPEPRAAYEAAKTALKFIIGAESVDTVSAEAGFKARHVLCQAIVLLAEEHSKNEPAAKEWVMEAMDAVDEGLKLAREWEMKNVVRFRPLAGELFCFGVRAYQMYQPQFLGEFILESLDPSQSPGAMANGRMHLEALRALWRELRESQKDSSKNSKPAPFSQWLEKLGELSSVENRLNQLSRERPMS